MVVATAAAGACAAPREGVHAAHPLEVVHASAIAAGEVAKGNDQETVHGWKLEIVGESARFFACSDVDVCNEQLVELPAKSVVAVKHVGRARPVRADGSALEETDVLRLTLAKDVTTSRGGIAADPHRGLVVGGPTKR